MILFSMRLLSGGCYYHPPIRHFLGDNPVTNENKERKIESKFWWPNVSNSVDALESAKSTQFVAYWIGGSYLVLGYLGDLNSNIILGTVIAILGLAIWRNFLWAVPIVATIGVIEAGTKIALLISIGKASGIFVAAMLLLYSFHGFRAWLALRKHSQNSTD